MENNENNNDKKFREGWNSPYSTISDVKIDESWKKFSKAINPQTEKNHKGYFAKGAAVAALFLVLFSTYFFIEIYNPTLTVHNVSQIEQKVSLPDGSLVFLKEGATIQYKEHFRNSRGVKLQGSAFFDVAEDSLKVFYVATGPTIIEVLGTTFYVQGKNPDENVEVSLFTGSVSVSVMNMAKPWGIVPGERFVYHKGKAHIETFNVNLSFVRGNEFIDVDNIALEKLYHFLSERFDYAFEMSPDTENKKVTLRIDKSDSLKELLELLSIISNTTYEVNQETRSIQVLKK